MEWYDLESDTWKQAAPMSVARHALAGAVLNGCIYATGGFRVFLFAFSTASFLKKHHQVTEKNSF